MRVEKEDQPVILAAAAHRSVDGIRKQLDHVRHQFLFGIIGVDFCNLVCIFALRFDLQAEIFIDQIDQRADRFKKRSGGGNEH